MQVSFLFDNRPAGGVHPWSGRCYSAGQRISRGLLARGRVSEGSCLIFRGPAAHAPVGSFARGDSVRVPVMFILVSFLFKFLIPSPPCPSPRRSPFFFVFEIFGGPVMRPRVCWPGASLRGIAPIFGGPAARPRGIVGRGGSVRSPYTYILVSFLTEFLIPFPSSFHLGYNPRHPLAGSVLLRDSRLAGGAPAGSLASGEPSRDLHMCPSFFSN